MLFSTAATEYMDDKKKRLRATTPGWGYRSAIRCHLMPKWGKREIETITFEQVQDWVDRFDLPGAAVETSGAVKLYFSTSSGIRLYGFENCACFIPPPMAL